MAPTITEVVVVYKFTDRVAENLIESELLLVQHVQFFEICVIHTEGPLADLKAVQMRVRPAHHQLQ
jgi:hypothetical protein